MNSRFEKFLRNLTQDDVDEAERRKTLDELRKSFAMLTQEEQKYANIFLNDVASGNAKMKSGNTFRDYITEYQFKARVTRSTAFHDCWGWMKRNSVISWLQM